MEATVPKSGTDVPPVDVEKLSDTTFRTIADVLPQIVWTARPDGIVDHVNRGFYLFGGITPDELPPHEWARLMHPDDLDRVLREWAVSVRTGRPHSAEARLHRADGAWRWHLVSANPIRDHGGRVTRWYGIATDIHDQYQAESNLTRAERLLQIAGRVGRFGGWAIDLATNTVEWSDEVCRIHELPPGTELTVEEALAFTAPEWRERVKQEFEACARDGTPYDNEKQSLTVSGRRIWVRTVAEAVRDETGRITHIQGAFQDITEHKEAQQWTQQQFRRIADEIPFGIWTAEPDGTLDYASKALYDFVGQPEDLSPANWPSIVHPDDRSRAVAEEQAACDKGEPFSVELRLRTGDGSYRWVLDSGNPVRDAQGRVLKYYGAVLDIHDRKLAEEALRANEEKLRAIFENCPECIKITSSDGIVLEMNPAGLAMIDAADPAEVVGRKLSDLIHPEDREACRQLHARVLAGDSGQLIYRMVGSNGQERWTEASATPLRHSDGRIESVLSVTRDITERRRVEQELQKTRQDYELILANVREGIHGLDQDGRIVFQNAAAQEMLGFELNESLGQDSYQLIHYPRADGSCNSFTGSPIYRTLHDGVPRYVEDGVFFRRDGTELPVKYSCAAITDRSTGAITGAVVNFSDVTAKRRYEAMRDASTEVLDLISAGTPLNDILARIADKVDMLMPQTMSSILLIDENGCLRHGAAPQLPDAFNEMVDGVTIGEGVGSCGTAAHRGELVVVDDVETDPLWQDFRDAVRPYGLRACWSSPVTDGEGRVLATLALYSRTPRSPGAQDIEFVSRAAQLVRNAIERSRESQALRTSEERFRQLAAAITEVFWMSTPDKSKMLYVSPAFEGIWGIPTDRLYDTPTLWLECVHPSDRERVESAVLHQAAGAYDVEYRVERPDGEVRWIADRAFPIRNAEGQVYRIAGVARDITARKLAEAALKDSELRFQSVARASSDVIWDWDFVADTIWWSAGAGDIFGCRDSDIEQTPEFWQRHLHPADHGRVMESIQTVIDSGDSFWEAEYRLVQQDRSVLEVQDRGCVLRNPAGRAARFIGGMTDISVRKRAERALSERMKELRSLYRILELTTDDGRSVESICANVAQILPSGLQFDTLAVARIALDEDEYRSSPWHEPHLTMRSPIWVANDGIGFVEIGYRKRPPDLSEGVAVFVDEERDLLDGVAIHVGRMIESRRMSEQIAQSERIRAMGELTGGIAHDFNNLLTVILGNAEILSDRLKEDRSLGALASMTENAAERGAELTNRLLAFARRQPLDPKPVSIAELLGEIEGLIRRTLGGHIEISIIAGDSAWPANIDRMQLENALLNLCINARDAMPEGGHLSIELTNAVIDENVRAIQHDVAPGEYVVIAVSDTGCGMTADVLKRACEPFFTTKPGGTGNGLGLSMVFGFVKQSKGHIRIYSEPGEGTTIRLFLPRAHAEAIEPASSSLGEVQGGSERILIVEDDELVRVHVTAQLEALGYQVCAARNGPEAMETIETGPSFDLLFTDVVMPGGMSGRDLANAALARQPDLKVLFTSGYAESAIVHHGRLDPGVHFLNKPYRQQELAAKLRQVLADGKPQGTIASETTISNIAPAASTGG